MLKIIALLNAMLMRSSGVLLSLSLHMTLDPLRFSK